MAVTAYYVLEPRWVGLELPQARVEELFSGDTDRLIVYAAEWCHHCERNAPEIKRFAEENPGVEVVLVFTARGSTPERIVNAARRWGLTDKVYVDWDDSFAETLGITGTPTFVAYTSERVRIKVGVSSAEELKELMGP